jgi:ATP-dependent exoDNAse (exonuclease V) beta subunit
VACTRARRSLQLSFVVPDDQKEARGLAALLCDVARPGPSKATTVADAKSPSAGPLTRLPTDFVWRPPALDAPLESSAVRVPPVEDPIADRFEVIVGISVHRALAWMATYQRSLDETIHRIPYWLAEQGDGAQQRAELEAEVTHHLTTAATSAQGRWILHPHEQHECEVALSSINEGAVVHVILDRTFVEHDTRWVIDFKTSEQTDAPAVARYQNQLSLYRRIAQSIYGPPVRSALFFTRNAHFVELS